MPGESRYLHSTEPYGHSHRKLDHDLGRGRPGCRSDVHGNELSKSCLILDGGGTNLNAAATPFEEGLIREALLPAELLFRKATAGPLLVERRPVRAGFDDCVFPCYLR